VLEKRMMGRLTWMSEKRDLRKLALRQFMYTDKSCVLPALGPLKLSIQAHVQITYSVSILNVLE
jgi:hypothetical protein